MTIAPPSRPRRGARTRALLAGGLVLGIGGAVTLASWSDSEWATTLFQSASFNLEGSVDGGVFEEHSTQAAAGVLDFTAQADNLRPGQRTAQAFSVRLDDTTTIPGVVSTTAQASGAAAASLSYGIVAVDDIGDCGPGVAGTQTVVPTGTALGSATGATTFTLQPGATGTAGEAVHLCIQITAADDIAQNAQATASWQFTATTE